MIFLVWPPMISYMISGIPSHVVTTIGFSYHYSILKMKSSRLCPPIPMLIIKAKCINFFFFLYFAQTFNFYVHQPTKEENFFALTNWSALSSKSIQACPFFICLYDVKSWRKKQSYRLQILVETSEVPADLLGYHIDEGVRLKYNISCSHLHFLGFC